MSKVFISYSYQDKPFVDWLVTHLKDNDVDIWYDKSEINIGDSIIEKIEKGIKVASIYIIVLSEAAIKSKWVNYELNNALLYKAQKEGLKILPILIESIEIPVTLRTIKYADFTKNKGEALNELIQIIKLTQRNFPQIPNWDELTPVKFENLVFDLLIAEGFTVLRQTSHTKDMGFDFLGYYHKKLPGNSYIEEKWFIEAKFYRHSKISISSIAQLYGYSKFANADVILLVANSTLTNSARNFISNKITDINVVIWDENDLVDLLNKYKDIYEKYFGSQLLDTDVKISIEDPELTKIQAMISELKDCPEGISGWKKYENICIKILKYLFVPPLKSPKIQSRTESGIDIRDANFPNRCDYENWRYIREDYDAKYILFEFKNYSTDDKGSNIDKSVVYQVRNYLKMTIGRIGIICGKKEPVDSGKEAQKQAFIEDRKLIVFINNGHLIDMLMKKYRKEEPSDVIIDLIDEFNLNFG